MKHKLQHGHDDRTVCGKAITDASFEYDLGKFGHDEIADDWENVDCFGCHDNFEPSEAQLEHLNNGGVPTEQSLAYNQHLRDAGRGHLAR